MEGGVGEGPSSMAAKCSNQEYDDLYELFGVELPPGFRFHPTDEEIIMHYLLKKVMDRRFKTGAIGEADFNKCEPWDLPKKAKMGEKEWFLFCQRDRKYPTGMRTNRATESGYWKATGKDKEIYNNKGMRNRNLTLVGMKKTLVFYKGRAPKGEKTSWVMHEYRLEGQFSNYNFSRAAKEEWVVCKVFYKNVNKSPGFELTKTDHSFVDHLLDTPTLPPLADYSGSIGKPSSSFATDHEHEIKGNVSLDDRKLQEQHDQRTFFLPHGQNYNTLNTFHQPNYPQVSPDPAAFPYQTSYYPTNFPFKGGDQMTPNIGILEPERMCKVENFSTTNSVVSHSETGITTEMTNEITSVQLKGETESKNQFDQELEGLDFSHHMSDLDSFWSY